MSGDSAILPRQVAVAVPFKPSIGSEPARFLLVSSRKHSGLWVLPKGQIEPKIDGNDAGKAALREAWEEGGIRGRVVRMLHRSKDSKPHKRVIDHFIPRAEYSFWLVEVTEELQDWPERSERRRKWAERQEATDMVSWRNDGQVDALQKILEAELHNS